MTRYEDEGSGERMTSPLCHNCDPICALCALALVTSCSDSTLMMHECSIDFAMRLNRGTWWWFAVKERTGHPEYRLQLL